MRDERDEWKRIKEERKKKWIKKWEMKGMNEKE